MKRTLFRPAAVALVTASMLLVSVCSTEVVASHKQHEWRTPATMEMVAAASSTRTTVGLPGRSQVALPLAVRLATYVARTFGDSGLRLPRREGSLPPARQRYRRTVHDDSDPPA